MFAPSITANDATDASAQRGGLSLDDHVARTQDAVDRGELTGDTETIARSIWSQVHGWVMTEILQADPGRVAPTAAARAEFDAGVRAVLAGFGAPATVDPAPARARRPSRGTGVARPATPYVDLDRDAWTRLSASTPAAAHRRRRRTPRRPRRPHRPGRGRRHLPPDLAAARPAHRGDPRAARRVEHVPARGRRRDPVRHRRRRLGRGRQVDHGPPAARAARPLARDAARPAGHHRRLPLPERRARAPRADGAQGLPGVVRPPRAAAVRLQGQGRPPRGPRAGVRPPDLRHPPGPRDRGEPPRRADRRGPQRPAARPPDRRGHVEPGGERLLRLLDLRRRPHAATSAAGTSTGSSRLRQTAFARPESYFHRYAALTDDEAVERAERIWDSINAAQPRAEHPAHPQPRHPRADQGQRPRGASGSGCASCRAQRPGASAPPGLTSRTGYCSLSVSSSASSAVDTASLRATRSGRSATPAGSPGPGRRPARATGAIDGGGAARRRRAAPTAGAAPRRAASRSPSRRLAVSADPRARTSRAACRPGCTRRR